MKRIKAGAGRGGQGGNWGYRRCIHSEQEKSDFKEKCVWMCEVSEGS